MKRSYRLILFGIAALLAAVSCTKSETPTTPDEGDQDDAIAKLMTGFRTIENGSVSDCELIYDLNGRVTEAIYHEDDVLLGTGRLKWEGSFVDIIYRDTEELIDNHIFRMTNGMIVKGESINMNEEYACVYNKEHQLISFTATDVDGNQFIETFEWKDSLLVSLTRQRIIDDVTVETQKVGFSYSEQKCTRNIFPDSQTIIPCSEILLAHPRILGLHMKSPISEISINGKLAASMKTILDADGYPEKIIVTDAATHSESVNEYSWLKL